MLLQLSKSFVFMGRDRDFLSGETTVKNRPLSLFFFVNAGVIHFNLVEFKKVGKNR